MPPQQVEQVHEPRLTLHPSASCRPRLCCLCCGSSGGGEGTVTFSPLVHVSGVAVSHLEHSLSGASLGHVPLALQKAKVTCLKPAVVPQHEGQGRCFQSCCGEANRPGGSCVSVRPTCTHVHSPPSPSPSTLPVATRSPPPHRAVERRCWAAVLPGRGLASVPGSRKDLGLFTPESALDTGCWAELGKWSMGWKACPSVALLLILASIELRVFS